MPPASSHVVHVDDVDFSEHDVGELRARRRRLGAAAGATVAGLSLWELPPGARSTPPHVHADEEEIFYVLRGSGLLWQGRRTYAIAAGDAIVQRCGGKPHTLIAGDDGLDVLAFAEGSRTSLTYMPRTKLMWAATRWLPADAPHPFAVDAEAGPLEVPEPEAERPPHVLALTDGAPLDVDRGEVRTRRWRVGGDTTGLKQLVVAAGAASALRHCHSAEEELFYVLGGSGEIEIGDERLPVRAGHVVARPPGTGLAHRFVAGDDGLELLAWGHRIPSDACWYPDTQKVSLRGLGVMFRVEPVGYWE